MGLVGVNWFLSPSVPAVAARRVDRLECRRERAMEDVQGFGTPQATQVGPVTYADLLAQFDAWVEARSHWETRTRWLPALAAGAADAIIAAKARGAAPYCAVFWHHFHGDGLNRSRGNFVAREGSRGVAEAGVLS